MDIYKSHPTCTVTFNLWLPTQTFRQELPKVNSHLFVQWDKVYSDEPQGWYLAKVISLSSDGTVTVLYRKGKTLETFNLFEINWFQPQEMANGVFLTPLYSHNHTTKHSKTHKVKGFADDLSVFSSSMKDHETALQTIDKHCSDLDLTLKPSKCMSFCL